MIRHTAGTILFAATSLRRTDAGDLRARCHQIRRCKEHCHCHQNWTVRPAYRFSGQIVNVLFTTAAAVLLISRTREVERRRVVRFRVFELCRAQGRLTVGA